MDLSDTFISFFFHSVRSKFVLLVMKYLPDLHLYAQYTFAGLSAAKTHVALASYCTKQVRQEMPTRFKIMSCVEGTL